MQSAVKMGPCPQCVYKGRVKNTVCDKCQDKLDSKVGDEVDLDGPHGEKRCFFSEPGRERWVPIYISATVTAKTDGDIMRAQFPLTLAWALTYWTAQGMTLRRARICVRRSVAGAAGVGYVAVTRVKHVEHLLFEEDLPP